MALEASAYDIIYGKLLSLNFEPTYAKEFAKTLYQISKELRISVNEILRYVTEDGLRFENEIYDRLNLKRTNSSQIGFLDQNNIPSSISDQVTQNYEVAPTPSPTPVGSFDSYKPPHSGAGAGIIVDRNGNMQDKMSNGGMACGPDCFTAKFDSWLKGGGLDPNQYKVVMAEGASSSGNIASACANKNCKYNFSDNTFTVLNSGKTYKAGESIDTIYSK